MIKMFTRGLAAIVAAGSSTAVFADASTATAALTSATADVNTIGWAVFAVLIAAMAFKYMRRAL